MLHILISKTESLLIARLPLSLLYHLPGHHLRYSICPEHLKAEAITSSSAVHTMRFPQRQRDKLPLLEHDGSHSQCYTYSCDKDENPSYFWII